MHARAPVDVWRSVRSLPDFWRTPLQVRAAEPFGDGLFQAGLAGALLFNLTGRPTRWPSRGLRGAVSPYSLLALRRGPNGPVGSAVGAGLAPTPAG